MLHVDVAEEVKMVSMDELLSRQAWLEEFDGFIVEGGATGSL